MGNYGIFVLMKVWRYLIVLILWAVLVLSMIFTSCNKEEVKDSDVYLELDSEEDLVFAFDDSQAKEVSVKSNGFWAVSVPDEADWITVSDMYGNGDAVLSVSVSGNTAAEERSTSFKIFLQDDSSVYEEVRVRQTADGKLDVLSMIPDQNFRAYCAQFDTDGDGRLSLDEASEVIVIDITPSYDASAQSLVISLEGIEYFTALESLSCSNNLISEMDLSRNTKLVELICLNNKLTSMDLSSLSDLEYCYLDMNALTSLDVTGNSSLKVLSAYTNSIGSVDLSNCPELTDISLQDNLLQNIDLSNNIKLKNVTLDMNQISSIDVTMLPELERLAVVDNKLTELNVTHNPHLIVLNIGQNQLKTLDVSNCPEINTLFCTSNELKEIDLSNNPKVTSFHCSDNLFTRIDLTPCPDMVQFMCTNQPELVEVDISKCNEAALVSFYCLEDPKLETIWVWPGFSGIPSDGWSDWSFQEHYVYDATKKKRKKLLRPLWFQIKVLSLQPI